MSGIGRKTQKYIGKLLGATEPKRVPTVRQQENLNEFKTAVQKAKWLVKGLKIAGAKIGRGSLAELAKKVMELRKTDDVSVRGQREMPHNLASYNELLNGESINKNAPFENYVLFPCNVMSTKVSATLQQFNLLTGTRKVGTDIWLSEDATHCSIELSIVKINADWTTNVYKMNPDDIEIKGYDEQISNDCTVTVQPDSTSVVSNAGFYLAIAVVKYYQQVNTLFYPLYNRRINTSKVIGVFEVV